MSRDLSLSEFVRTTQRHNPSGYLAFRAYPNTHSPVPNNHVLEVIWSRPPASGFVCTYFQPETLGEVVSRVISEVAA